jgi:hypothetical protein
VIEVSQYNSESLMRTFFVNNPTKIRFWKKMANNKDKMMYIKTEVKEVRGV